MCGAVFHPKITFCFLWCCEACCGYTGRRSRNEGKIFPYSLKKRRKTGEVMLGVVLGRSQFCTFWLNCTKKLFTDRCQTGNYAWTIHSTSLTLRQCCVTEPRVVLTVFLRHSRSIARHCFRMAVGLEKAAEKKNFCRIGNSWDSSK